MRPERVQIGAVEAAAPEDGSRLEGTIAEIVFLGMYTQFHVETPAGRIVSHRLADESTRARSSPERASSLSWEPEHTSVLGDRFQRPLALERSEAPLGDSPSDLGGDDDDQGHDDHDDGDGDHLRQLAREAERGVEVDRGTSPSCR